MTINNNTNKLHSFWPKANFKKYLKIQNPFNERKTRKAPFMRSN